MIPKIAVVGNCQAAHIGTIMSALSQQINIVGATTVHELNNEAAQRFKPVLDSADIIVSQPISDSYPVEFVRSNHLKEEYGSKIITMPNIFYRGYGAELIGIKDSNGKKVEGILGDYHNSIVLYAYQQGISADATVALFSDVEYYREAFKNVSTDSLEELKKRERFTDIKISDFIEDNLQVTRLFHTFNHPSSQLLLIQAKRLLKYLGIQITANIDRSYLPDFLATFIPALMPSAVIHLKLDFEAPDAFRGFDVSPSEEVTLVRKWIFMNSQGYVERSFRLYDVASGAYRNAIISPQRFSAQLPDLF